MAEKTHSPIPRRLKEARTKVGLSQKALGIAIGVDEFVASGRMNHYEQGLHTPDYELVNRVSQYLNIPPPYFYTEDNDLAATILNWGTLNKTQKKKILSYIKSL